MGKIAQENAYAERINGTIKNEFIEHWKPQTFRQLKCMTARAVHYYNHVRPHNNLSKKTPKEFINQLSDLPQKQGKPITIFEYQKP